MFIAVDTGGTKTLVAELDASGAIQRTERFETPKDYREYLFALKDALAGLNVAQAKALCIALPGKVDTQKGVGLVFGNLPWHNVHIVEDLQSFLKIPVYLENDAKLAGLGEASKLSEHNKKVLYVTIGTGIGAGVIRNGALSDLLSDMEPGDMPIERNGGITTWQAAVSGKAIQERYGKAARDITDHKIWQEIAHLLALGLLDLIAVVQPDTIILGGGVGTHYDKFSSYLKVELAKYHTPLMKIPHIRKAKHPEEAVLYGCYQYIQAHQ